MNNVEIKIVLLFIYILDCKDSYKEHFNDIIDYSKDNSHTDVLSYIKKDKKNDISRILKKTNENTSLKRMIKNKLDVITSIYQESKRDLENNNNKTYKKKGYIDRKIDNEISQVEEVSTLYHSINFNLESNALNINDINKSENGCFSK